MSRVFACWTLLAAGALCETPLVAPFAGCCAIALPGQRQEPPAPFHPGGRLQRKQCSLLLVTACWVELSVLQCWVLPNSACLSAEDTLAIVVLAPLFEEALYRGVLLRDLRAFVGAPAAVLITSALFASSHIEWPLIAWTFAAGVLLGGLRLAGAHLTTLTCLHAGANASLNFVLDPLRTLAETTNGSH